MERGVDPPSSTRQRVNSTHPTRCIGISCVSCNEVQSGGGRVVLAVVYDAVERRGGVPGGMSPAGTPPKRRAGGVRALGHPLARPTDRLDESAAAAADDLDAYRRATLDGGLGTYSQVPNVST